MVKLGPDVQNGNADAYSGYLPEGNIFGFSMMHESGTGGAPKYGVVSQMPVTGDVPDPLADLSQPRASPDQAGVGYYKSSLANGITVELSATQHAGLYLYTFPDNTSSSIVVDVSRVLSSFRGLGWEQHYSGGSFSISKDGRYEGSGIYNNGWNLSPDWTIYFCGKFNIKPENVITFGDGENDVGMFNASGYSVHMGNAMQAPRDAAKYSTGTNNEGGVGQFLDRVFRVSSQFERPPKLAGQPASSQRTAFPH